MGNSDVDFVGNSNVYDCKSDNATVETCEEDLCSVLQRVLPPCPHQNRLISMLQAIDQWLGEADVPYWVTGGTLLGAVRHKGFIPHDDDVDIEIMESDLTRAMDALGAVGRSYRGQGEWIDKGGERTVRMGRFFFWGSGGSFTGSVDVFLREDALEELAEFPSRDEIFPLQRLPFNNITVAAPRAPESMLARTYGQNWASEAVVFGHSARGRVLRHASLPDYETFVAACGYKRPLALLTAEASLSSVDLESHGELRDLLWQLYGWASPYSHETQDDDAGALELLGLESRQVPLSPRLSADLHAGGLVVLQELSGAQLELVTSSGHSLMLVPLTQDAGSEALAAQQSRAAGSGIATTLKIVGTPEETALAIEILRDATSLSNRGVDKLSEIFRARDHAKRCSECVQGLGCVGDLAAA